MGRARPLVSILLPVRDAVDTLGAAVESLLAQSFTDHEVLIHDDGSTDGTTAVLRELAARDRRVRVVGDARLGLVGALQSCAASARGELLARMDADDVSHPERLAAQVALLAERPEVALASCLVNVAADGEVPGGMRRYVDWLNRLREPDEIARDIYVESPVCHPTVIMRRAAYESAGGYVDDGNPEDYGLWLRFHAGGLRMAKVRRKLFTWHDSANRLTRTDPRYSRDRFLDLKLRHLIGGPLAGVRRARIWGAGRTGRRWSRALGSADVEVVAFYDIDSRKTGHRVHGAPVEPLEALVERPPQEPLLVAVGADGAREKIRAHLAGLGCREPRDHICVA